MSLPNYKQIAMNMPSGTPHMMSPGPAAFNILKERLRPSGGSSGDRGKDNSSPFVHSSHGNPAFTPQKIGKGGVVVDPRIPKPPKPPEKPLMPFMRYSRKVWDQVKTANPELKLWEVSKIIAQMWKDAPDSERQEFIDEYEAEKIQYIDALKVFHATPEYGTWNRYHMNRLKAGADSEEPTPRSSSKSQQQERRLDIQPAEDDEDQDDGYTFKHVAYARFLRNHRLINEIFSDAVVPDVRSVVTTNRMQVLKRQVQSLTMHQMKLETELQQIEEKFEAKKRKFIDSSEQFQDELKKHCKPAVDEDTFKKMVERQFEAMRRERLRQLEEPKVSPPKPEEVPPNAGAPSAPNTTIRQNEVDKPDAAEVLQPMETEPVNEVTEKKVESAEPVTTDEPPAEVAGAPAAQPADPSGPANKEETPAENTTPENMDIEPPTDAPAASHPSPPSNHPTINKPPSDITPHQPYASAPPSHPVAVNAAPTASTSPVNTPHPAESATGVNTVPAAVAQAPAGSVPHSASIAIAAPSIPHPALPQHHQQQQPPPGAQPHIPPQAIHHEPQPMGQPPYGAGYGHPPPPQGAPPAGVRPYYPPYQYHPYPPPHQQYAPPPPGHYMPRPGMHYPDHGPPPPPMMMDGQQPMHPPTHGHYGPPPPAGPPNGPPPAPQQHEHPVPVAPPQVMAGGETAAAAQPPPAQAPAANPRPEEDGNGKNEGEPAKTE